MKRLYAAYALVAAAVLFSAGCSAKGGMAPEAPAADYYRPQPSSADGMTQLESATVFSGTGFNPPAARTEAAASSVGGDDDTQYAEIQAETERKLVKRADLRVRVEDLPAADALVNGLMARYGAYAASTEISENSRTYTIRVPQAAYDAFLAAMSGMGRTLHRSESAEDVTLRYYDLEGRLATKRELLKTFQSYLAKAKNIEEILSVEERIAGLQSEIDGTGRELRRLGNLVDYAAVSLEVYGPVAAAAYRGPALSERITELFSGFGDFLSTLALVITGIVIYGIPVLLLLAFFFWLCFGKIGLLKKLWRITAGGKSRNGESGKTE
jgi:hypothetical protein